jgi:site-specific recombinase XerD
VAVVAEPLPRPGLPPRLDPARRPLPLEAWPAADRRAWLAALAAGDVLEPGGAAAGWRPHSKRNAVQGWGHYLAWLARTGQLEGSEGPGERVTPERLVGYIAALRARGNAPATVLGRVDMLALFLRAVDPGRDPPDPLRRLLVRLRAEVEGVGHPNKRGRLQASHDLLALGRHLMQEAEARTGDLPPYRRAVLYRDGLMIALLAARPLRLKNFAALELDRHLVREGLGWRLVIPGAETKTRRPLDLPFPSALVPALERYLAVHRPVLAARPGRGQGQAGAAALWLSLEGGPLSAGTLCHQVRQRTRAAFGRAVNPHLFRDCAATSLALEDPAHVRIAAQVLGHAAFATTEKHYNLAQGQQAATAWHETLDGLRRAGKGKGRP